MSYSRTQERGTQKSAKQSLLIVMLMALVSLFAVGCGDSGEDFVVTGNQGNNGANTGAVTFQFARAQQTVPAATALFDIRFFSANGLQVFEQLNIPFNTTITVQNVPTSATRAVVTAKNAAGIPLATIDYTVGVVGGGTANAVPGTSTLVTFDTVTATPDPTTVAIGGTQQISLAVGFSNGDSLSGTAAGGVPVFTSSAPGVATVNATGLVTGVTAGPATITVAYALNGVTRTDTVAVTVNAAPVGTARLELAPATVNLTNAAPSAAIVATFFPANSTTGQNVTAQTTAPGIRAGLTYAAGTFTSTAIENSTGNVTVSFTSGATTVNGTVAVNVNRLAAGQTPTPPGPPGTPARLVLFQENLFIAPGGTTAALQGTFFPANSTVGITVGGATANAFSAVVASTNPALTSANWNYVSASNWVTAFNGALTPGENNSIDYRIIYTAANGQSAEDTIKVTATNNAALLAQVQSVALISVRGNTLKLPVGSVYPLTLLEVNSAGTPTPVAVANTFTPPGTPGGGQYLISSSSASVVYDPATGWMTFAGVGQATVTVTRNNTGVGGPTGTVATLTTTTTDATALDVAPLFNAALDLTGPNTGSVNAVIPYKADLIFKDGTRQDITPIAAVATTGTLTVNQIAATFNAGSVTIGAVGAHSVALANAFLAGGFIPNYSPNLSAKAITGTP